VVGREGPVDLTVEQRVPAGELLRQLGHDLAGRAITAVPNDGQRTRPWRNASYGAGDA